MPSLLVPMEAVNIVGSRTHGIGRTLTRLATAGGKFSVRPHAIGPVGTQPVRLDLTSVEEIDEFWAFYDDILGACEPFWLPTFQRDFVPIGTIGSGDGSFNIQDRLYSDLEFPDPLRTRIAFVFGDGTILKREITDAATNSDGTENLVINASLGQDFTQERNNGICYLLYGRLQDDMVRMAWDTHDIASVEFTFLELREDSPAGSTL